MINYSSLCFMFLSYLIFSTCQNSTTYQCKHLATNECEICFQQDSVLEILSCKVPCYYRSADDSIKCVDGFKNLRNMIQCMKACCVANTFQSCLHQSTQDNSKVQQTVIIVLCSIIPIAFIVGVYFYNRQSGFQTQTEITTENVQQVIQKRKNESIWFKKDNNQLELIVMSEKIAIRQQKSSCSICLQFNFNLKTSCGHFFHAHCFIDWLKRNQSCPLCVTKIYNPVRIECQNCHKRQIRCNLNGSNHKLKQYKFIQAKENQKIICSKCQKKSTKMQGLLNKDKHKQNNNFKLQNSMDIIRSPDLVVQGQIQLIQDQ